MKKIILAVILLAVAGGAVYWYVQAKKSATTSYQQTIIGDWKIDSIVTKDSNNLIGLLAMALDPNLKNYHFQFKKDGSLIQLLGDSLVPIKHRYEWKDSASLVFIDGDSLSEKHSVQLLTLTNDQFLIRSTDSSLIYFKKQIQ